VLPPVGTVGGVSVRGGAPGTRETDALSPTGSVGECHAVVLTGGSAFGLAVADGVMSWNEAAGRGFVTPAATIPIVGAAVVFDLREPGQPRPDAAAGHAACEAASDDDPPQGPHGAGAGCTVAKIAGRAYAAAGGQGWAVERAGPVSVGALLVVNAAGEILAADGSVLRGTSAPADAPRFPEHTMEDVHGWGDATTTATNTVIGCVATNARLSKLGACRAADLAHGGISRAVDPAHTSVDGDTLFLLATGEVEVGPQAVDLVAALAARAVARAIRNAVS
jgi:L-aminopeptidase/D-esterase-like protein